MTYIMFPKIILKFFKSSSENMIVSVRWLLLPVPNSTPSIAREFSTLSTASTPLSFQQRRSLFSFTKCSCWFWTCCYDSGLALRGTVQHPSKKWFVGATVYSRGCTKGRLLNGAKRLQCSEGDYGRRLRGKIGGVLWYEPITHLSTCSNFQTWSFHCKRSGTVL